MKNSIQNVKKLFALLAASNDCSSPKTAENLGAF